MATDFEIAVSRLTAWLRDYGDTKGREFVGDITLVLLTAKAFPRMQQQRDEARQAARHVYAIAKTWPVYLVEVVEAYPWLAEEEGSDG